LEDEVDEKEESEYICELSVYGNNDEENGECWYKEDDEI
jgi:hypothetical protein